MLALVLRERHAETVVGLLDQWTLEGTELHSPLLARYEIASVLARSRVRDGLSREETDEALAIVDELDLTFHATPLRHARRAIEIAVDLGRHEAYDAVYLALAEELGGQLWTLDGPLVRNAGSRYDVNLID